MHFAIEDAGHSAILAQRDVQANTGPAQPPRFAEADRRVFGIDEHGPLLRALLRAGVKMFAVRCESKAVSTAIAVIELKRQEPHLSARANIPKSNPVPERRGN